MDYNYFNKVGPKQNLLLKGAEPINRLLKFLNLKIDIAPVADSNQMISFEQRLNLFHLLNEILVHNVEGDIVELGCYVGNSSTQIQSINLNSNSTRQFHVFDKFGFWGKSNDILAMFKDNFHKADLPLPVIHQGLFHETIPQQLPEKLAFVHIDGGYGGDHDEYMNIILFLLEEVYERMSEKAICLLMDYHDTEKTLHGTNSNPGVKSACDIFFKDKPEKVFVLYGNRYSHGYFRKK